MSFPPADRWVLDGDGVDDWVSFPSRHLAQFTVALDVLFKSETTNNDWLHLGDQGLAIGGGPAGGFYSYFNNGSWTLFDVSSTGLTVQTDTWYRVVVTYDQSTFALYVNGTLNNSVSLSQVPGTDVGSTGSLFCNFYSGSRGTVRPIRAANVRVYSSALSAGQVADIENQTSNLVRHYALDEGTGSTATNTGSDGSANGTIIGASWVFIEPDVETDFTPLAPNAILATANLKDTLDNAPPTRLADIQDSPDDPDSDWWTAVDVGLGTIAHVGFPTPPADLTGTQTFNLLLRKPAGEEDPSVDISVLQDDAVVGDVNTGIVITSTTGQLVSVTRSSVQFPDSNGTDVSIRVASAFDPNDPVASGMTLTFSDEFATYDAAPAHSGGTKWSNTTWWDNGQGGSGLENVDPDLSYVEDDQLVLECVKIEDQWWCGCLVSYIGDTQGGTGFHQKYGYFEARIKAPAGQGTWGAWWMLGKEWLDTNVSGIMEIDIVETDGNAAQEAKVFSVLHNDWMQVDHQQRWVETILGAPLSDNFHRYGVLWSPYEPHLRFFLDGVQFGAIHKFSDTDRSSMFLIVSNQIGSLHGNFQEPTGPTFMYVDYVRVWQFPGL